ncbi:polysaccharide biosynthesis tyrosine autokinase [Chryseobacterium nematophagum]|uniref:non-specific protein-tyrosine kinase n=1 Tax=Chryseobacterium nematophagum TaxID=2305228 RepID=A0A3M7TFL2_9FLAO|nr:tyrosine-protein kinase [Chryseobacterium nematophagum]RNA61687.1 polysaccharide biosynthesis tyrosine autokinase [Chryseobacterium nematophagum]
MKINNKDFDLHELIHPYLKRWTLIFGCMVLALIISIFYIKLKAPLFKVQTSVLIKDAKKMSDAGDISILQGMPGFGGMGTNSIENELEIFQSKKIIEDVVKDLKLQIPVFAEQGFYDLELYKDTNPYQIFLVRENIYAEKPKKPVTIKVQGSTITLSSDELSNDIKSNFNKLIRLPYADIIITKNGSFDKKKTQKLDLEEIYFKYIDFQDAVDFYQNGLAVTLLDKDATVIGLSMNHINKEKAIDILNAIVKKYNFYAINDKNVESEKTKNFIDDRISIISKELGDVESEKESFKTRNKIVDVQSDASINLQTEQASKKKLIEIDTQLEWNKMLTSYFTQSKNELIPLNLGIDNPVALANINNYNKFVQERNTKLESATPSNPVIKDLDIQISNLRNIIKEGLVKERSALQISRNSVEEESFKASKSIATVPGKERMFRNIERQQQIKENLFLLLLQKREEAAISMAITSDKARVVDKAYALQKPVAPRKMIIMGGALITGFLLSTILILVKELLNNKIIVRGDIEKLSNTPVIAEIPKTLKKSDQLIKGNDLSPLAEAFRILVTNLKFILRGKENAKIIMVTSSMKGEGKTFVSVNLALALTTPKKKVLVIGSDIRNPQLQRYNPSMKLAQGLTEYLNGDINDVENIIHPSGFISGTDFIYSGAIPPNPNDLLQNDRYETLLNEVRSKYDYVILDTAPLMPVTDSFLISHLVDSTVYVVRSDKSLKEYMNFANTNIENEKLKSVVFVLNDIKKSNFAYGNQYGYSKEENRWWHFFKKS